MLVVKHDSILILHMWVTDSYVSYGSNLRRLDICYCKKDMDNTGQPCSKEVSFEVQTINRIRFLGIRYF